MSLGKRIAGLRKDHGLTQEELADRVGVSRQSVNKWESDTSVPDSNNLIELGRVFSVDISTLINHEIEGATLSQTNTGLYFKKNKLVLIVVLVIVIQFIAIINLNQKITLLNTRMDNFRNEFTHIYYPPSGLESIEKEYLREYGYELIGFDFPNSKMSLQVYFELKKVSMDAQMTLEVNGERFDIERNDSSKYNLDVVVPIKNTLDIYVLIHTTEDIIREPLESNFEGILQGQFIQVSVSNASWANDDILLAVDQVLPSMISSEELQFGNVDAISLTGKHYSNLQFSLKDADGKVITTTNSYFTAYDFQAEPPFVGFKGARELLKIDQTYTLEYSYLIDEIYEISGVAGTLDVYINDLDYVMDSTPPY